LFALVTDRDRIAPWWVRTETFAHSYRL